VASHLARWPLSRAAITELMELAKNYEVVIGRWPSVLATSMMDSRLRGSLGQFADTSGLLVFWSSDLQGLLVFWSFGGGEMAAAGPPADIMMQQLLLAGSCCNFQLQLHFRSAL